jgi:1,4-dihydroxy-2-naphthoate octaprenyltransferase
MPLGSTAHSEIRIYSSESKNNMREAAPPSRRDIWIRWLVYPSHSLPTAAAPVLVATGLAVHDHVFAPIPALVGFVASWLIHIAGLFTDNYELLVRHPSVKEHPELIESLKDGRLSLKDLRWAIITCLTFAALTGPYLLYVAGTPVIAIGLLGVTGSLIYSAGPIPFGKIGLSDVHFFVMFGVLAPAAAYYIQMASHYDTLSGWQLLFHHIPFSAFVLGLPLGAFAVKILIIDDIRDRHFDAEKGWHTGPICFGIRWSRVEYTILSVFAYLMPFLFWYQLSFNAWVLLPLMTMPFACMIGRRVWVEDDYNKLLPMTSLVALLCLTYAAFLAVGVALSSRGLPDTAVF